MSEQTYTRRLSAILSADAVGYSRLMRDDEEATVRTITAYRTALTHLVRQYRGRVVDAPGDNLLAEFTSVVDAVNCAVEIQRELAEQNAELPENRRMPFRIGLNLGDVLEDGKRIYGDGVNVAARIEGLAKAGGICISGTVYDAVESKIGLDYEFAGEHEVKNIDKPVRVYQVVMRPLDADELPLQESESALPDKLSIAVLPFVNMSADTELEYFCDGISEEIITTLSKLPVLFVIARNSTFVYKGKSVNIKQVGSDLGVRYVLEGSVRRSGDRFRITAQLIDVKTGHHLWAERYDRNMEEVFALQDEITMQILDALNLNLISGSQALSYRLKTPGLDSSIKMAQATAYLWRGNKEDLNRCIQLCEQIVAIEPKWPSPYGVLGFAQLLTLWNGWSQSPSQSLQKAFKCANKCIDLDERNHLGHGVLTVLHLVTRQYDQSLAEGKKAIDLAPSAADAYGWYGMALAYAGEPAKGINMLNKAISLNPFPPGWYLSAMGLAKNMLGEYEKALVFFKQALAKEPTMRHAHVGSVLAYARLGQNNRANAHVQEIMRTDPEFTLDFLLHTAPYKDRHYAEKLVDALRLAGIK